MTHKFDVSSRSKLDNPKRREILPPDQILANIDLKEGEKMVDIGCGTGYFSLPAAKIVGPKGKIFALDIRPEMIADLEQKALENNISNITTVLTEEYDFKLDDNLASAALVCLVLHEIEDKFRFLNEAKRIMKPGSKIAIVEWVKRESELGPPVNHRLEKEEVMKVLQDAGYEKITTNNFNENFYIMMAIRI